LRIIPAFIYKRIEHRPYLAKVLENIAWLFMDRLIRMGVGLFVSVWIARYLGVSQFGLLSYATAIVALFGTFATLGLNDIVVRDLVRIPETAPATLCTAFVLQLVGGILATLCVALTVMTLRPGDHVTLKISVILGLTLVFQSSAVIKYWFESQVQSRFTVWIENSAFLFMALVRVGLILMAATLIAFVWAILVESVIVAAGFVAIYAKRNGRFIHWNFVTNRAKELLRDSWPVMIASASIVLYMKIDQVMLGVMISDTEVGIYAAAVRLSEIWYFIPVAINASLRPMLLRLRETNLDLYEERLRKSFTLMFWISVPVAILFQFVSAPVVSLLYGPNFVGASEVLKIHIWAGVFVFLNNTAWNWYFAENKQHLANRRIIVGLLLNVALNLLLIPSYGSLGAAWATLISRAFVSYFGQLMSKETLPLFLLMNKSMILDRSKKSTSQKK
jgi:PST family polysaccharide transporter